MDFAVANMRFALIGNAATPMCNFRLPLIEDIVARGHDVVALAPDYTDAQRAAIIAAGATPVDYPLARTGLNPLTDLKNMLVLAGRLRALAPGGVLCFGIKPATLGLCAAKLANIPARYALITGLGYAFTEDGKASWKRKLVGAAARLLYRHALRQAQVVFMQNPDDADTFVDLKIVRREKTVVVNGTGVRLADWPPALPVTDPVTFLLAARLLRDKGVLDYVAAARAVKVDYPQARFILAGGTDTNPEAISREQVAEWVVEGVIEWPGHVDMRSCLPHVSVFVLPSYREGVPRSSQEAMAMGRAIITTDVPGCRETVIDGVNGYLIPVRDSNALATAMRKFLARPDDIGGMGRASRAYAEKKFDAADINAKMIAHMAL